MKFLGETSYRATNWFSRLLQPAGWVDQELEIQAEAGTTVRRHYKKRLPKLRGEVVATFESDAEGIGRLMLAAQADASVIVTAAIRGTQTLYGAAQPSMLLLRAAAEGRLIFPGRGRTDEQLGAAGVSRQLLVGASVGDAWMRANGAGVNVHRGNENALALLIMEALEDR